MPRLLALALPWIFLLVALLVSAAIIGATAPAACDELPTAFGAGEHTEVSGDRWGFESRCAVTDRSTGVTVERAETNWSGILASVSGCIGAWLLGAALGGLIDRWRGVTAAGALLLVSAGALVAFFL